MNRIHWTTRQQFKNSRNAHLSSSSWGKLYHFHRKLLRNRIIRKDVRETAPQMPVHNDNRPIPGWNVKTCQLQTARKNTSLTKETCIILKHMRHHYSLNFVQNLTARRSYCRRSRRRSGCSDVWTGMEWKTRSEMLFRIDGNMHMIDWKQWSILDVTE